MVGVASAATSVVIGYIAGGTRTIRVGAGGIMLPNHSPLVIAEQFGTLESLYPGRIDLGLGRAPGTDQRTLRALRRDPMSAESFPQDVVELQALLRAAQAGPSRRGRAGHGARTCRSGYWARASTARSSPPRSGCRTRSRRTSRPTICMAALATYRAGFQPSAQLAAPYAMVGANVVVAPTRTPRRGGYSRRCSRRVTNLLRGARGQLQPPIDDIETLLDAGREGAGLAHARVLVRRLAGDGPRRARGILEGDGGRRDHRRRRHLRSGCAAALVRAARRRHALRAPAPRWACQLQRALLRRPRLQALLVDAGEEAFAATEAPAVALRRASTRCSRLSREAIESSTIWSSVRPSTAAEKHAQYVGGALGGVNFAQSRRADVANRPRSADIELAQDERAELLAGDERLRAPSAPESLPAQAACSHRRRLRSSPPRVPRAHWGRLRPSEALAFDGHLLAGYRDEIAERQLGLLGRCGNRRDGADETDQPKGAAHLEFLRPCRAVSKRSSLCC